MVTIVVAEVVAVVAVVAMATVGRQDRRRGDDDRLPNNDRDGGGCGYEGRDGGGRGGGRWS